MISRIFIDANLPVYAAGRSHALREPSREVLVLVAERRQSFWTNAEVLQELMHRYRAINRWAQGKDALNRFSLLLEGRIMPIFANDVLSAADLADRLPALDARDLLHLAVMARVGSDTLVSADRGFDQYPVVRRLDPADVSTWRDEVETP